MNVRSALKTQYHAAMAMLKQAIEDCPDSLWAGEQHPIAFWRVAFHTLFFTHLYLQEDHKSFKPWEHHRGNPECFGRLPWPPHDLPEIPEPYTKQKILEYWRLCDTMVDEAMDKMNLDAPDCGFPWYNLPKLDHQINNIRHIQHHAALLAGRLRQAAGIDVQWVGRVA